MGLYPFQKQVCRLLSVGKSVILLAPTGAGKTRAALYPFLRAWEHADDFPRKCIYSVPLRVLANQFWDEYEERANNFGFCEALDVTIQTGARSEDPRLEGNLIFTTIDQTLSNFLNIPYALSLGQGNLNSGAVTSSYLVFDELHLFDPETTLPTTLHLLRLLRGVVPFLVMTATLSEEMVRALAKELGAEPLIISPDEAATIPSQHKTRRMHVLDGEMTAPALLDRHRQRSVAICNTVDRAQALFEELRQLADPKVEVRLLHSRFLRKDREAVEIWLRREFGKDKRGYSVESAILVATQVVEVGLDITSQTLHTELAPAASVIQRAGRCARYEGEEGDVYVCRLPLDNEDQPRYAPYVSKTEKAVCQRTWQALSQPECLDKAFDFRAELTVVNQAHQEADQRLLEGLRANRFYISDRIAQTIEAQERGAARELIRAVDSRTVIVHSDPASIENPWAYEGFGIFRGNLFGAYRKLEQLANELGEDWLLMTANPLPEDKSSRERTVWRWRPIVDREDLVGALIVAVNPRLAHYNPDIGLRLGLSEDSDWQSPLRQLTGKPQDFAPYRRETFQEHIGRMLRVYEYPFLNHVGGKKRVPLAEELAYAAQRVEAKYGWPKGTLDRLWRLGTAVHDLGKLDIRWQEWAHRWQKEVSTLRGEDLSIPNHCLVAHTDYDDHDEAEQMLTRKLRRMKPNHAAESAAAAMDWLLDQANDQALARAALTAVVRHHSSAARGQYGPFRAHPEAARVLAEVLADVRIEATDMRGIRWNLPEGGGLSGRLIRPRRESELLPYLLLARALRLADQRSQELT
ncbi:MAG: CRISPR-associated helicase Cas3' [Syntrophobacteria bacterium]